MLLSTAPVAQTVDLRELQDAGEALSADLETLDFAIERQVEQNARLLSQLDASDTALTTRVTFADLRQAQFEVATANTRVLTMDHQIREQAGRIDDLNEVIVRASAALRVDGRDTLQRVVDEAALALQSTVRDRLTTFYERLVRLRSLLRDNASLRQEQLSIIQRAITLDALDGYSAAADGPLIDRVYALVQDLSQSALSLSNAAAAISETNPGAVQRRNLLRLRADEMMLRSNARLTDASIVEAHAVVNSLAQLSAESAVPTRLFQDAVFALDDQTEALRGRLETTDASERAAGDLAGILTDPERAGIGTEGLAEQVEALKSLLVTQRDEINALLAEVAATRATLVRDSIQRERMSLFQRDEVRFDAASRTRIVDELLEIPGELASLYAARLAEVRTAVEVANPNRLVLFGVMVLAMLVLTALVRQRTLRRVVTRDEERATAVPLEVLRRNLFWLMPLATWALFAQMFAVSRGTASALYPLLAIPAAAALLRDFTSVIVSRRTTGAQKRIGFIITRSTEVAMVLTALVVFAYFILAELPLLPSTASAINRLSFSVFVLAALPMLLFVFFFAAAPADGRAPDEERARVSARGLVSAALSLLPPLALIATGIAGLAGYRELAALLLEQLGTAIIIAATLALALGVLSDVKWGIHKSIGEHDPGRASFVQQNLLQPVVRVSQVLLVVLAGIVAANVFDWTVDTPGIREVIAGWQSVLFTVNEQPYTTGNVLVGILSLVVVFWFGAWCQRVTYSVLLRKVRDVGIRQSLSVFAQYMVIVVGVLLALSAIGFDVTTLTVFAASLGVGIGFGLQNVVNNFISGILLLVERPLRIGDIVTVGGQSGTVSQIGIRSMRMRTFDEFDLVVPNSQLIAETFTNWTRSNSLMRVLLTVGISYDDTPEDAVRIATRVLQRHQAVVRNPAPLVTVDEFGDNSVNLRVCYYVDLRGDISGFVVRSEVLAGIWRAFGEAGISIPYPQRDLHIIAQKGASNPLAKEMERIADDAPQRARRERDDPHARNSPDDFASDAIDKALSGD